MRRHYRTVIYWFGAMAAVLASLAVWSTSDIAGMSLALLAGALLGAALQNLENQQLKFIYYNVLVGYMV